MVFNLTNQTAFRVIKTYHAIKCGVHHGPTFKGVLGAMDEPFNLKNAIVSAYYGNYENQLNNEGFDTLIDRNKAGKSYT